MTYVVIKNDKVVAYCNDMFSANAFVNKQENKLEYEILARIGMSKCVSRVTMVDGKVIYNNKDFWIKDAETVYNGYDNYSVTDILGEPVSRDRFGVEMASNRVRLAQIDGRPGQIDYNMIVGSEFISLFREECILTKFTKESDTSPMIIFKKLDTVINMLQIGGFREAKQYLQAYREQIVDDFLTNERIDKYIAMLDSADAIEYATDEDYFYTAPEDAKEE